MPICMASLVKSSISCLLQYQGLKLVGNDSIPAKEGIDI